MTTLPHSRLALLGGKLAVQTLDETLFKWPVVTPEDEAAILDVLRKGSMSGTDVTMKFEQEFLERTKSSSWTMPVIPQIWTGSRA